MPLALRQELAVARPIFRNRMVELSKRGTPKFHAIQVLPQALKGSDKIANDGVFG
jgi:hypothetical protein